MVPGSSRSRAAALILTALLAVASCAAPAETLEPDQKGVSKNQPLLVTTKCADLVVLGLRGSGQSADLNNGLGQELNRSVRQLAAQLHKSSNTTVRIEAVKYAADRSINYYAGVADGRGKLHRQFKGLMKDCPKTRFAFIGFSEGAHAVHEYAFDLPADQVKRVPLVAMLADPRNNADDAIERWSYAKEPTPQSGKLGPGERFQNGVRNSALSLCVAGDEICNWPKAGGPATLSETHKEFYEKPASARSTAKAMLAVLRANGIK